MEECDYYSCESDRDVLLAYKFGFKGYVLPVYPNTGGFNLSKIEQLRCQTVVPSERKLIMLKGYQGWAGRSLVGIRALERCADILAGYTIVIHSNTAADDVQIAATLLSQSTGVLVELLPEGTSHDEILEYHSMARISIGLSISDGISTSFLEAMAMGSFPIQSFTAAADEWVKDLYTGLLVPPEDPEKIELAIRKALSDDKMVDLASIINFNVVKERLCYEILKSKTIDSYNFILQNKKI
jgi:glycosyltransferase involved in cell wall biosynthesis